MLENALSDTASWQTRKWSSCAKFQVFAWMTINANRKTLNQLETHHQFAHKLYWNACSWHELEDLCIFGSRTLVPISWMCKKQTSASHRSTESEIISLDAGLRMDGLPALDLWDIVIRSTNNTARQSKLAQGDLSGTREHSINKNKTKTPFETRKREIEQLSNVDYEPTNTHSSQGESQLYIVEDNEAVIKIIIKGRTLAMRHVSRTHRVALDWLFDRNNLEPKIQIKYVDTKNQLAAILTTASFSRDEWNHLIRLFNKMSFSMFSCTHFSNFLCDPMEKQSAMSKRGQETTSSEGSPMAKAKPVNLVLRSPWSARENPPQDLGYHAGQNKYSYK